MEIVVARYNDQDRERLLGRGYVLLAETSSVALGGRIGRFRGPARLGPRAALGEARRLAPSSVLARNDLYRNPREAGQFAPQGALCGARCEQFRLADWSEAIGQCAVGIRIGVIDTGVEPGHPSLAGANLTLMTARSDDRPNSDKDHGTAVVSLLVGQPGTDVAGLVPAATILAADAFHGEGAASRADAFDLIKALDWLLAQNVNVINLSLSGPDNALLKLVIESAVQRGISIVAASGRPERSNQTGYPARYPGVVAVGAVDQRLRSSRLSTRGAHLSFSAPGAGLPAAQSRGQVRFVSGTSFAAPFVAAAYAVARRQGRGHEDVTRALADTARDLGAPGRDPVFGWGLIQLSRGTGCEASGTR